ncbi:MAG: HMA2 domain-containing protein [Actinomycetota bacterium]
MEGERHPHPTLHRAHVRHAMPGRVRLSLPAARGRPHRLDQVRRQLSDMEGVDEVRVNPDTGSVLVLGRGARLERLKQFAVREGLFEIEQLAPELKPVVDVLSGHVKELDDGLRRATGGRLDLAGAAILALAGVALVQVVRGEIAAPAMTLLWYAAGTAMMARSARPS